MPALFFKKIGHGQGYLLPVDLQLREIDIQAFDKSPHRRQLFGPGTHLSDIIGNVIHKPSNGGRYLRQNDERQQGDHSHHDGKRNHNAGCTAQRAPSAFQQLAQLFQRAFHRIHQRVQHKRYTQPQNHREQQVEQLQGKRTDRFQVPQHKHK